MTDKPTNSHKSKNLLNVSFVVISLVLSLSALAFYSLWRASEITRSIDCARKNQVTNANDWVGALLPTTKPIAPSFIYPPSGDDKNNWQTVTANFQKEVSFEMALPKNLPYTKATSKFNQTALTYYIFENSVNKQISLDCEKKYIEWQKKSLANPETSGVYPPCNPIDSALFSISVDTTNDPIISKKVTSSTYRDWNLSELSEDGEVGQYYLVGTTQLRDSDVSIRVSLNWPSKAALDRTESLLGYNSQTLLNNLLTQMNFGENGTYGKPN